MVIGTKTDMRIEKKRNGNCSILIILRLTSWNVTPYQCTHQALSMLTKALLPGCLGANGDKSVNEFRRIDWPCTSFAFDSLREDPGSSGDHQQNADKRSRRPSPCLELLSYNSSNNCRRLDMKRSKPNLSEETMHWWVWATSRVSAKVQVCLRDSQVRYAVIGVSRQ